MTVFGLCRPSLLKNTACVQQVLAVFEDAMKPGDSTTEILPIEDAAAAAPSRQAVLADIETEGVSIETVEAFKFRTSRWKREVFEMLRHRRFFVSVCVVFFVLVC